MSTSPATPAPAAPATIADRRLHPLSWLFVLLGHLKSFIVPVLLAFILFCQLIDFFGLKIPGLS